MSSANIFSTRSINLQSRKLQTGLQTDRDQLQDRISGLFSNEPITSKEISTRFETDHFEPIDGLPRLWNLVKSWLTSCSCIFLMSGKSPGEI